MTVVRMRYLRLFIITLFFASFYGLLFLLGRKDSEGDHDLTQIVAVDGSESPRPVQGFLIHTPSCQIPDINPFDPSVMRLVSEPKPVQCGDTPQLLYTEGSWLKVNTSAFPFYDVDSSDNLTCTYWEILRVEDEPDSYGYRADEHYNIEDDPTHFKRETRIDVEFIIASCRDVRRVKYRGVYGFFPPKPSTEAKKKLLRKTESAMKARKLPHRPLSVLLVTIDSVSRLNLLREMSSTSDFLLDRGAIPMYGFVKVGDNTFPNAIPDMVGRHEDNMTCWRNNRQKLDDCPFIWKNFSAKGYVTTYAEDSPSMSTFNLLKTGFVEQPVDYYHRPLMLAVMKELPRRSIHGLQCHGDLLESEHVLRYAKDFVLSKKDTPYFAFFWNNYLTHNNFNGAFLADKPYLDFFQDVFADSDILNNTLVFFFSDHGVRTGRIRSTYSGWLEERMPFFYVWFPKWFHSTYPSAVANLRTNSRRLTSPFDFHKTLLDITESRFQYPLEPLDEDGVVDRNEIGVSWFDLVPLNRTCADAGISPHWCTCQASREVDTSALKVQQAVSHTLDALNQLFEAVPGRCAHLSLDKVMAARVSEPKMTYMSKAKGKSLADYLVVFQTNPGQAHFEATVRYSSDTTSFKLMGSVSRLNQYKGQSECVEDAVLRKYCFCI